MVAPAAILTDIEGTTTPIHFVHTVLFPYARARLPQFCAQPHAALDEVVKLNPGRPALETLLDWMDADAKVTPLKTIQRRVMAAVRWSVNFMPTFRRRCGGGRKPGCGFMFIPPARKLRRS
jgi:methionine salvage enolase-phosphatase E1